MNFKISKEGSTVLCNGKRITDFSGLPKKIMQKVKRLERKTERTHKRGSADSREIRTTVPAIRRM